MSSRPSLFGFLGLALFGVSSQLACHSSSKGAENTEGDAGANDAALGDASSHDPTGGSGSCGVDAGGARATFEPDGGFAGPDETILASGLSGAASLTVVGSYLYWLEHAGPDPVMADIRAVKRVGTTGGSPSTVFAIPGGGSGDNPSDGFLWPNFASDGTSLYLMYSVPPTPPYDSSVDGVHLAKCGLDGSNMTDVVAPGTILPLNSFANELFVVEGTLYLHADTATGSGRPVSITQTGVITSLPLPEPLYGGNTAAFDVLYGADHSSLYFTHETDLFGVPAYATAPRDGTSLNDLYVDHDPGALGMGVTVVEGEVYIASWSCGRTSTIVKVAASTPADGSAGTVLASLPGWDVTSIAADVSGMYVTQATTSPASVAGVYSVSMTTGATALLQPQNNGVYGVTLDATRVYWLGADGTLHGKAR